MKQYFKKYQQHYNSLLKLGLPIIIGQLGVVLVGFIDTMMVGQFDTTHLAAAAFVNNVFNIPIFFALGFSYGLTPLVGQYFGQNNKMKIGQLLKNSLLVNLVIGLLLTLIMGIVYFNIEKFKQPTELLPIIKPYFLLQTSSLVFILLFNSFKQFSDGVMNTKTPMYVMLTANALNIIFNYIFIYGKLGFPEMGLFGAGVATLIARIFMLIIFIILIRYKHSYVYYKVALKRGRHNVQDIIQLNKMGWMVGVQMSMETALFSITAIMVGWIGTVSLAAHQVLISTSTFGFMIYYGIGAALSIKVSSYYGTKDMLNLRQTTIAGFHIILAMSAIISLIFYLSKDVLGYVVTDDAQIVKIVAQLIMFLLIYQFGDVLQITFANALRGIGDVIAMAIISFIGYFMLAIPSAYILAFIFEFDLQGIWSAYPIGLTATGLMLCTRFYYQCKKYETKNIIYEKHNLN